MRVERWIDSLSENERIEVLTAWDDPDSASRKLLAASVRRALRIGWHRAP